ncbi:Lypd1 [Phodopus roborovskii]|uniref:Lypd1 protein n=1 Tax=Phodopus roborovskii TaxID=109678 RepID=A0AAV0A307_PHORO|nr:Lypd1 [Phodopus roborovskii]
MELSELAHGSHLYSFWHPGRPHACLAHYHQCMQCWGGTQAFVPAWASINRIMYRKSCASSAACLIASAGYQSFCSPGKLNSVCISCCNTPLCNGPRPKKRGSSASAIRPGLLTTALLFNLALCLAHC